MFEIGRLTEILDVSVHTVEVVLAGASAELERKLSESARDVRRTGDRLNVAFAEPADFDASLELLSSNGARVISVTPVKQTLEDHFVKELGKETRS